MARVCARRAAGILISEYLLRRGYRETNINANTLLLFFVNLPDTDEKCKQICRHLLMKVNQEHNLPAQIDLIQEVTWLKDNLLIGARN